MKNLRKAARDRECTLRIVGVCNYDTATTILAHIRRGNVGGMGLKPPDLCAVIACSSCHEAIGDGRREYDGYIVDAMCRTLEIWTKEGLV
jgi:hypothetical protein